MKKKNNQLLTIGAVIVGIWALVKYTSGTVMNGIRVSGKILSLGGIGAITPTPLKAGSTGNIAEVNVVNTSKYTGTTQLAPYTFTVRVHITTPTKILASESKPLYLGAGGTGKVQFTFDIPAWSPETATAVAELLTSDGVTRLAIKEMSVSILAGGAVTPGGTITF